MIVKVTISDRDEIVGALVRALAVQVAGFAIVRGLTGAQLAQDGFYRFEFSANQLDRFKEMVDHYLPQFRASLEIVVETN